VSFKFIFWPMSEIERTMKRVPSKKILESKGKILSINLINSGSQEFPVKRLIS